MRFRATTAAGLCCAGEGAPARQKVLLLGNSQDLGERFEGKGKRRHEIVQERLSAEFGVPVEIIVQPYWPTERLPGLAEGWVRDLEPDMVYMNVTTFPFGYESLPLRAKRVLGRLGPAAGAAGLRFADSKRWAHNDGVHCNAAGHARVADELHENMRAAWRAHLDVTEPRRAG